MFAECAEPLRSFWQATVLRFQCIQRGEKEREAELPARQSCGWVDHPEDWECSSWRFYFGKEEALLGMDT
jgi:hypothetical protein